MENVLCCPVCGHELNKRINSLLCDNNHCFDIAKEGYVNLLLCNEKNSKNPGDNKEMMIARRDFLNSGYYAPLLAEITKIIQNNCMQDSLIVEAGCGEGYYISNLLEQNPTNKYIAFDISKEAVKMATKRTNNVDFFVASSYKTHIKSECVDCVLVVFAPFVEEEFSRILSNNGMCIVVKPNTNHLKELKSEFYNSIKEISQKTYIKFDIYKTINITYEFLPKNETDCLNLFKMTPFFYQVEKSKKDQFYEEIINKPIRADFIIEVLKKK